MSQILEAGAEIAAERDRRKRQAALGYRVLAALRWGDLGDGHISARDPAQPDHFWMLRYGVSFDVATVDDLVLVGPDGDVVEGEGGVNRAGYHIHQPLHAARPDVVGAVHTHTQWGTPFSALVRPFRPITQEACVFFEAHGLYEGEEVQVTDVATGARIAAAMGEGRAVILRNHGLVTVGATVAEAVGWFVTAERVAEAHVKVPDAVPISAAAARTARAALLRPGAGDELFEWLVARHVGDPSIVG